MDREHAIDAPQPNPKKPYRVSFYRFEIGPSYHAGDYRWYWQANLVSWVRHHLLGQGCNTWNFKS